MPRKKKEAGPDAPARKDPAAHLVKHRFKPGQSGNPAGRPKGRSITAMLRELLDEAVEGDKGGRTAVEAIAAAIIKAASQGDISFINLLLDRTEGGARQVLDVTSNGEALAGQVVIYLPDNGRDGGTGPAEDRPAGGPADAVPV